MQRQQLRLACVREDKGRVGGGGGPSLQQGEFKIKEPIPRPGEANVAPVRQADARDDGGILEERWRNDGQVRED